MIDVIFCGFKEKENEVVMAFRVLNGPLKGEKLYQFFKLKEAVKNG